MGEEIASQEFGLKDIDETRNYLVEELDKNELMKYRNTERFVRPLIILNTFLF